MFAPSLSLVRQVSPFFILHVTHGAFWRVVESAVVLCSEHSTWKQSRRATSLAVSLLMWRSGMNQTASCDGWSWKLSARELFKAVQVHRQLLPSKIDARAALKDCSLVQSLGTEIEAHPWQSNGDMTHHRRIIWREGRWKTQGPYSINPVYWKFRMSTELEDQSTVKQEAWSWLVFFYLQRCRLFDSRFRFLLNVAWSAEYHNIPVVHKQTKNNGLNKQQQAQIPDVFHYFVQW